MPVAESIWISLFLMLVVFVGLFCLCLCVKLFSFIIAKIETVVKPQ